jgi:hypothetical protein
MSDFKSKSSNSPFKHGNNSASQKQNPLTKLRKKGETLGAQHASHGDNHQKATPAQAARSHGSSEEKN